MTKTKRSGWTVVIIRDDGTEFLCAVGVGSGPAFFHSREAARRHKRECESHGFKCRLTKLALTYEVETF